MQCRTVECNVGPWSASQLDARPFIRVQIALLDALTSRSPLLCWFVGECGTRTYIALRKVGNRPLQSATVGTAERSASSAVASSARVRPRNIVILSSWSSDPSASPSGSSSSSSPCMRVIDSRASDVINVATGYQPLYIAGVYNGAIDGPILGSVSTLISLHYFCTGEIEKSLTVYEGTQRRLKRAISCKM